MRLSYTDMARSHVKELAREAFELEQVVVDADGDLPFPCGTALFYVSVVKDGRFCRVWARAVTGVAASKQLLAEVNEVNATLTVARAYVHDRAVWVEGQLPVETLRPQDLAGLCYEVGTTADRIGSMTAAVHGGVVAFPDGCADRSCEE